MESTWYVCVGEQWINNRVIENMVSEEEYWRICDNLMEHDGIYRHTSCELASKMCVIIKKGNETIYKSRW